MLSVLDRSALAKRSAPGSPQARAVATADIYGAVTGGAGSELFAHGGLFAQSTASAHARVFAHGAVLSAGQRWRLSGRGRIGRRAAGAGPPAAAAWLSSQSQSSDQVSSARMPLRWLPGPDRTPRSGPSRGCAVGRGGHALGGCLHAWGRLHWRRPCPRCLRRERQRQRRCRRRTWRSLMVARRPRRSLRSPLQSHRRWSVRRRMPVPRSWIPHQMAQPTPGRRLPVPRSWIPHQMAQPTPGRRLPVARSWIPHQMAQPTPGRRLPVARSWVPHQMAERTPGRRWAFGSPRTRRWRGLDRC